MLAKGTVIAFLAVLLAGCAEEEGPVVDDEAALSEATPTCLDLGGEGKLCATFNHVGGFLHSVTITRSKPTPMCDFRAFAEGFDDGVLEVTRLGRRHPECQTGDFTSTVLVFRYFASGFACAGVVEDGLPPNHESPRVCVPLTPAPAVALPVEWQ
jgi:hypothetical protein